MRRKPRRPLRFSAATIWITITVESVSPKMRNIAYWLCDSGLRSTTNYQKITSLDEFRVLILLEQTFSSVLLSFQNIV